MTVDTTPVPRAGVKAVIGNRNPVSVVSTVVARKMQVQPTSRFPRSMPASTTRPVAMPMRLMITCTRVKVAIDNPKIIYPCSPSCD